MIHPTAIISTTANVDPSCTIGPYSVVDDHVVLGANCRLAPHVHITGHTTVGEGNVFHTGCVIGDAPQDFKYRDEPTRLRIGDHNIFREQVTVHRSNKLSEDTVIGSHNILMANSHIAHNCSLGDRIIIVNGALIAGHVTIADGALISAHCLVHQFVRIGRFALMQGGSLITKDLAPATVACRFNEICGLNIIGLRRAGVSSVERLELKRLYHHLFRSDQNLTDAVAKAEPLFGSPLALEMLQFIKTSKRGVVMRSGAPDEVESNEE